jgi:triphosphatase
MAMSEIELKLQVPATALAAVEREVAAAASRRVRLQAIYFDTSDRRLAAAGIALRLRKEGRRWVQTLKTGSAHGMERGEHNVARTLPAGTEPSPDLALHAGTAVGEALAAALTPGADGTAPTLVALYRTDIWRRHRLLRSRHGTVELALDRGEISATVPDGVARRWPVCELEIELRTGSPHAVTDVAARWARRHGLWLDTRSKAERGDRLSRGLGPTDPVPAVKAQPMRWRKNMSPAEAWTMILASVAAHALPNWSELAGGSLAPEPVHQLRVALRRLRSARRFLEAWPGVPLVPWDEQAAALFGRLGELRDRDVLALGMQREVNAALADAGGATLSLTGVAEAAAWSDAESVLRGGLFIELMAELVTPPPQDAPAGDAADPVAPDLRVLAVQRLQDWHVQLRKDAKRFMQLDDEARHRVRKRLKRLRYAVEFSAGLFPKARVERYIGQLERAQERLGEFNDLCVATAACRLLATREPQAWFALGWLSARREVVLSKCGADLARWREAKPFWD